MVDRRARFFTPGFHPRLLVNVIYDVDTRYEEVNIKERKVGVLVAKDGAALRPGQAFADPFPVALGYQMLDAETSLKNHQEPFCCRCEAQFPHNCVLRCGPRPEG
jgi:hypothetical protein